MGGYSNEESFRIKIWMDNMAKIEKHNRQFFKVRMSFFKQLPHNHSRDDREFTATHTR